MESIRDLIESVSTQLGGQTAIKDITTGFLTLSGSDADASAPTHAQTLMDQVLSAVRNNKGKILTLITVIAGYALFRGANPAVIFSRGAAATALTASLNELSDDDRATARAIIARPQPLGLWDKILASVGYETDNYQLDKIKQIREVLSCTGYSLANFRKLQKALKELTDDDFEFYSRAESAFRGSF